MQFFKQEWKAIIITLWLILSTVFLFNINDRLGRLQKTNSQIASTLDSVESISLSTDSALVQTSKKVDDIHSNTAYIVERVRRR